MEPEFETAGLSRNALAGEVALVTGAGQGIGREVARLLAHLGAAVVVGEIAETGAAVAASIQASGGRSLFCHTDVSNEAQVSDMLARTAAAFGPVTVLINNAALEPVTTLTDMSAAEWDRVMAINLRGAFLTVRGCLPSMLARGRGVVINLISAEAMPGMAAYIASKQGLVGFTQSLATEFGSQGLRAIAFAPGMVDTPGLRSAATGLAPRLGLTTEQFLGVSLHPAYAGLMPVSHAAAATALLVARYADDYQGETVNGYTLLERAGVIAVPIVPARTVPGGRKAAPPAPSQAQALARALEQLTALHVILIETQAEFDRLPVFVRPLARGGFKTKSGLRLQDWPAELSRLDAALRRAQTAGDLAAANGAAELQNLSAALERLASYYAGVPAETARFTKDEQTLAMVSRTTQERLQVITGLRDALAALIE